MDVERLLSKKFETNELVLELTVIAYNILCMIAQYSLKSKQRPMEKKTVKCKRLRTVISTLIQFVSHVVEYTRQTMLSLGKSNIWHFVFWRCIRKKFNSLQNLFKKVCLSYTILVIYAI